MSLPPIEAFFTEAEGAPAESIPSILERLADLQARLRGRLDAALKAPTPEVAPREPIYTIQQAAKLLGVTPYYINTLVTQGKLAYIRLPGTIEEGRPGMYRRILARDLDALLERSRIETTEATRTKRTLDAFLGPLGQMAVR